MKLTARLRKFSQRCSEAMQEKQVTVGNLTFRLDKPFLVMATQNQLDQEGTYPPPEAQVDRFMMKVLR